MDYEGVEVKYQAGQPYVGAIVVSHPGPGGNRGEFIAWDPTTGKKVWGKKEPLANWGGALATAYTDTIHPSLGNYLHMVSGADQYPGGVDLGPTESPFPVDAAHLGSQLEAASVPWRSR